MFDARSTTEAGTVPGAARLTRYTNTEVDIDVEAPSGGILLLNDVWHPWWRAIGTASRERS
jgi:hypothetical protein